MDHAKNRNLLYSDTAQEPNANYTPCPEVYNFDPNLLYNTSQLFPAFVYDCSECPGEFPNRIMSIFFYKDKDGNPDPSPFSLCFAPEDEKRFLEMLKNRVEEIRQNIAPKPLDPNRNPWKCTRLCHFCKTKWGDTDDNMCIYIENHIKEHGMDETIKKCTRDGFDIGFYEAPG